MSRLKPASRGRNREAPTSSCSRIWLQIRTCITPSRTRLHSTLEIFLLRTQLSPGQARNTCVEWAHRQHVICYSPTTGARRAVHIPPISRRQVDSELSALATLFRACSCSATVPPAPKIELGTPDVRPRASCSHHSLENMDILLGTIRVAALDTRQTVPRVSHPSALCSGSSALCNARVCSR